VGYVKGIGLEVRFSMVFSRFVSFLFILVTLPRYALPFLT